MPSCTFLQGPFPKRKAINAHSQRFSKSLVTEVHQYVHTLSLWTSSEILLFSCSCGQKRKEREIIKFIFCSIIFLFWKECFMLLHRVCVSDFVFFRFFLPLLSKFHLCFPSRICEKYFQYISLNGFLVLTLLPRHPLLTAFGNRILAGWTLV